MKPASAALMAGFAVLAVAWLSPLPTLASRSFTGHMIMHLMVLSIATPLLGFALSRFVEGNQQPEVRDGLAALAIPASVIEMLVIWAWHSPDLHAFARQTTTGLFLEQGSFLFVGLLLWTTALLPVASGGASRGTGIGAGVLALLLTSMHMTLLGALIGLSPRPLYVCYGSDADVPPWLGGLLNDQHLGGALMITAAGSVYLIVGLTILKRFLDRNPSIEDFESEAPSLGLVKPQQGQRVGPTSNRIMES